MDVQPPVLGFSQEPLGHKEPKGDGYDEIDVSGHLHQARQPLASCVMSRTYALTSQPVNVLIS